MDQERLISRGLGQLGLDVDSDLPQQLAHFVTELMKWNKTFNLTAIREFETIVSHHLLDSLSIQAFVTGNSIVDVGTGGGFPGIPLALLFPQKQFMLLDSNGKKTRFLQQMKISLGLANCEVIQGRVEQVTGQYAHITCRAFASLEDIMEKTAHLLMPGGQILAMKAKLEPKPVVPSSAFSQVEVHPLQVPGIDAERHLVVIART